MSEDPTKQAEQIKDLIVSKAPPHVRELLKNVRVTLPIYTAFDAIELVLLEAQRNIVTTTERADLPATIVALDHLLKHFRLFKDQGEIEKKRLDQSQQR